MLDPKLVVKLVSSKAEYLQFNYELLDVFEGNLCQYLYKDLEKQLSPQSYAQIIYRTVPINVLPKIIDKLTNIYQTTVIREVKDGKESDKDLLGWYVDEMNINRELNCGNELFNLCKTTLLYPYLYNGKPRLREIHNDKFIVYSDDPIEPYKPTHVIILAGKKGDNTGIDLFWVVSKDEFVVVGSDERVHYDEMARLGLEGGINPYGRLPFVYVNQSKYQLMPKQDVDLMKLTKVIPIMISDLNLSAMFQSFSIIYGIDINDEQIKYAPNAFWRLTSDPTKDSKPEIGQIKPQVDYAQVLQLIESQLSMWLGTKGIRASSVGALNVDNFASGISKVIDEMDTFEARQKQISYFSDAEKELWDLILNVMHPYWAANGMVENKTRFTPTASVKTTFAVQLPMQARGQLVTDLKNEFEAGFTSRRRAIMKLNPQMVEAEVLELIQEIDEERTIDDGSDLQESSEEIKAGEEKKEVEE